MKLIAILASKILSLVGKLIGKGTFTTYRLLDKPIVLD